MAAMLSIENTVTVNHEYYNMKIITHRKSSPEEVTLVMVDRLID